MKKKLLLTVGLALCLTSLGACATPDVNGGNETTNPDTKLLEVKFNFDKEEVTITSQDDLSKKEVGDNFKFSISLKEGLKVKEVKANGKVLNSMGNNLYAFKLVEGTNNVDIVCYSTVVPYTATKLELNKKNTSETLWKNMGYPHFPTTGNQKLLVIPVTLKGHEKYATKENKDQIEKAFFGTTEETYFESVSSYYKKSSFGKLNITGTVTDWFPLNLNEEEIFALKDPNFGDSGLFSVSNMAIDWVKQTYKNTINLDEYDNNDDGFIDGIYFVYSALDAMTDLTVPQDYLDLRWNHTFYNIRNGQKKPNPLDPCAMTYSWSSFNMMNRGKANSIDAHTYIHEFGHQLGLDDYYDTAISQGNVYTSPMGGLDMMDYNIGDHSMYSKYALGWTTPTKISGNSGEITVKVQPSYKNGDFVILTGDDFNGLPFDEYIAIEYLSNEKNPNNLNNFDSETPYPTTGSLTTEFVRTYRQSGIRVTHIDARAIDYDTKYSDDINKMVKTKFSNTGSTRDGFRDPNTNNNYVLTTLISKNKSRNVQGTKFTADSSDLFKQGDKFTFVEGKDNNYSKCLPSLTNKLNDGSKINYLVSIESITDTEATIKITAN